MTTYTRTDIGLRAARPGPGPLAASDVVGLVFHWPAMASPIRGAEAVKAALRRWQAYHMDDRGWSDIAYQVAVDQDGSRYLLRGLDTQSAANGDEDVNNDFGAVLLVLAPGEEPTPAMIRETQAVVRDHRALFPRSDRLLGHNEVRPEATACPGPVATRLLSEGVFEPGPTPRELLRADLNAAMAATKEALGKVGRRPRLRYQLERAKDALSKARKINRGDQ